MGTLYQMFYLEVGEGSAVLGGWMNEQGEMSTNKILISLPEFMFLFCLFFFFLKWTLIKQFLVAHLYL